MSKVQANAAKIKKKQDEIKAATQKKLDKKFSTGAAKAGGCGCGGGDKKEDDKSKPVPANGKLEKVYGPVGCGCKKCQKAAIDKVVKSKEDQKKEKEQVAKAKMQAKKIKAKNHEKKMIDKRVNE